MVKPESSVISRLLSLHPRICNDAGMRTEALPPRNTKLGGRVLCCQLVNVPRIPAVGGPGQTCSLLRRYFFGDGTAWEALPAPEELRDAAPELLAAFAAVEAEVRK